MRPTLSQDVASQLEINTIGPQADSWNSQLIKSYENNKGYAEANDRRNENLPWEPTFKAKKLPRQMLLRWQDRSFDSGSTLTNTFNQLNQFGWNLNEIIEGYDTLTLYSITLNMAWFTQFGYYIGVQMQAGNEVLSAQMITSADFKSAAKMVQPTWMAVNNAGAGTVPVNNTSNMGTPQPINSVWAASVRNKRFSSITVTLCDEGLKPLTYIGSTPGTAYEVNMLLLLQ